MIFIDSNIWCYYFDQRLPEHNKVREYMRNVIMSKEIASNTLVAMEVAHYLVRHFGQESARKKIEFFVNLQNIAIEDFNRQAMVEALKYLLEYAYPVGLGGRDATVIATIASQGIKQIVSHDDIFKRLSIKLGIEVVDPI